MNHDDASLLHQIEAAFPSDRPDSIGIAVSGGGDSMALLHLTATWAAGAGVVLQAVTVDHGLRRESTKEAEFVAKVCRDLGVSHTALTWKGWDRTGNLQDQARRARYSLMAEWVRGQGFDTILLGHTADDQAETFLMRLAREAGVDGLSGMEARREAFGVIWCRPLLCIERQELRDYLMRHGHRWIDDPSNEDERFDRIKARKILQALRPLGIDSQVLSGVAANMLSARHALDHQTALAAREIVAIEAGDVCFDRTKFAGQPAEIQRRLLAHAIKWVASADYGPRGQALRNLNSAILANEDSTLHGCRILAEKNGFRITRELHAVQEMKSPVSELWDGRWRILGPENKGFQVSALGEKGLKQCKDWRETGRQRASLLASPAIWRDGDLIAAPLAGMGDGWSAEVAEGADHFFESILSH